MLAGCATRAPHEQASQTCLLSLPPSKSPHRWCSATKATKAVRTFGMGSGDYHKRRSASNRLPKGESSGQFEGGRRFFPFRGET